jgi:predicted ATPase/archaellum biogenesis ATPase FlaH
LASEGVSTSSVRAKVSTGYDRLDEALHGGFPAGTAVVLSAPASDEVPILIGNFLKASNEQGLLICRTLSSAETITQNVGENVRSLVCSDKPVSPTKTIIPGKGIENLTDLNLQIGEVIASTQPKRLVIDVLSDILLRLKALQTRKWLTELLERLRSKSITTLIVLNPYMHSSEEVQAIVDLFDGNVEIFEKEVEGSLRKFLRVKWMHGVEVAEKEFPLLGLTSEPQTQHSRQVIVPVTAYKEPRWTTPLISRVEEFSKLRSLFESALANRSNLVALRGEAGVGKSRLMHEFGGYAQTKNATVLSGRATENGLPYAPWVDVTRQYTASAPGEVLRRMLGVNASEVVKLVPDIAAKLGTIPPPRSLGEQQDKIRFYETVTQLFIAISNQTPLLLLFEDMQYADQPSLDLLEYFIRSTNSLRVLTICSSPPEQAAEASPLEQVFLKLNRERMLANINVKNLGKAETVELMMATFGERTVSPEFADLIYHHTAGNPFFVEEVLRSLVEDGTIYRTEKGWDRRPIQDITIPRTVKTALRVRLTKLDPETLSLLQWAAVVGVEFDFEVLKEATQLSEDALLEKLEAAIKQGLIVEVPRQGNKFGFADGRIRELLLDELIQVKKKRYHTKIAEAMEKTYAKNLESQAEVIATHYSEAEEKERALKYFIIAGDRNRLIHANTQAANDYGRALTLTGQGEDVEKAAILEKLARSYESAGTFQDSVQTYEQAIALYENLKDLKSCARIIPALSFVVYRVKGLKEGLTVAKQGLKYVEGEAESSEAAKIYSNLAWQHGLLDEYEEANLWAQKALDVGEKTRNFAAVTVALLIKASYLLDTGRVDEGLPLLEKSLEIAKQHDLYYDTMQALLNLANYTYPRDLSKARGFASHWLELGKQENNPNPQANALCWLSFLDWLGGDWTAAMEEVEGTFEIQTRLAFNIIGLVAEVWGGMLRLSLGDMGEAEKYIEAAAARDHQQIPHIVQASLGLGKLRLEQGKEQEAEASLEKCMEAFKKSEFTTMPLFHVETLLLLTSIYAKQGRVEEAGKMSDWALRLAETLKSNAALAMGKVAKANVLLAKEDRNGALETYREALGFWGKAGWPYYHARTLVVYSEALVQTNPEESKKRLQEAAETFRKLGAKRDLEKAQAKLQD